MFQEVLGHIVGKHPLEQSLGKVSPFQNIISMSYKDEVQGSKKILEGSSSKVKSSSNPHCECRNRAQVYLCHKTFHDIF
jgi:hypothetical protein